MIVLSLFILGSLFSLLSLKYTHSSYIYISICWSAIFILLAIISKGSKKRSIWFNFAFLVLILGALEVYSYYSINSEKMVAKHTGGYKHGYFTSNDSLGYAPVKDKRVTSKKIIGDQVIYDVVYTIGESGLRISPLSKSNIDKRCVLFFGGSFTFGEGVNDHETMPYVVGELGNREVYNFGFHGYGAHQMLSAIEHGVLDKITDCKPQVVVYQALVGHIPRSAGHSPWDNHGPKYILDNGSLKYLGHFDDGMVNYAKYNLVKVLSKSNLYKKFFDNRLAISDEDTRLFIEIVGEAQNRLKVKYKGVQFHVILWDTLSNDDAFRKIQDGLNEKAVRFHLFTDIIPGILTNRVDYEISELDRHPNALTHRLVAKYVISNIIGRQSNDQARPEH